MQTTPQRSLTAQQFQAVAGTADWRVIGGDALAWFTTSSHSAGARLVRRLARAAAQAAAPEQGSDRGAEVGSDRASDLVGRPDLPDADVRAGGVRVRIRRPGDRFTGHEVRLATAISTVADELGATADPSALQLVQVGVDTRDAPALAGFWEQVLGHDRVGEVALRDPLRRLPSLWFQEQDDARPLRNRLHLDVVTPQPVAARTLAAVPDLGGTTRFHHGYYATVADADGNEVDLLPLQEGADRWDGPGTEDWRLVFPAMAGYRSDDPSALLQLVDRAAELADDAGLALGIDLRPGLVVMDTGKDLWEMHDGYQLLAAQIQAAARELGLRADPDLLRFVQVGVDAVDVPGVRRFWAAALGYAEDPRPGLTDLICPHQLTMPLFLQPLDPDDPGHPEDPDDPGARARRAQRNRIHLDVFLPDDQAERRLAAALAAGGRVTHDAEAPAWWTVADPEGNEVCLAVSPGREERWGE